MPRYLLTASLLNAWGYCVLSGDKEDFLKSLNREPIAKTEAMIRGDEFEAWAAENLPELQGAVRQAAIYREIPGFLLYGKLDFLKAGTIYDTKHTSHYEVGKYYGSPQTSMYFALVPEARAFTYIVSTGNENIFRETYRPNEAEPIALIANRFTNWLVQNDLFKIYQEKWSAN